MQKGKYLIGKGRMLVKTEDMFQYGELYAAKAKKLWEELNEELKLAKDIAELRIQLEFLEIKQNRLFMEYGKAVFLAGGCEGPGFDSLRLEINSLERDLQKTYLNLEKLRGTC